MAFLIEEIRDVRGTAFALGRSETAQTSPRGFVELDYSKIGPAPHTPNVPREQLVIRLPDYEALLADQNTVKRRSRRSSERPEYPRNQDRVS